MIAERVDPRLHPRVPRSRAIAKAIEDARDLSIRKRPGEIPDDLDHRPVRGIPMLAGSIFVYVEY